MKRLLVFIALFGACVIAMGATRSSYVQYDGVAPGASANELWTPKYLTVAFLPREIDIIVNGATNTQYFELTVYLCDTMTTAATTQANATDSFTVKPTADATGTTMLEYVGPMSGQMRITTPANFAGSAHAFN